MFPSNLTADPLLHPSTQSSLLTLTRVLETSLGPRGRLKLLDNTRELTSSSQRLLHHISIKDIFAKITVSTVKRQLKTFNDGGLLCGVLILKLVQPFMAGGCRSLPSVGGLYDNFAVEFLQIFKKDSCFKVDFSDLKHLRSVVMAVVSSKPGCVLSRFDKEHLCSLLLRAFLDSIPTHGGSFRLIDCFRFVVAEGLPVKDSKLLKGLLLEIPEAEERRFVEHPRKGPIKIALFTCSLAGDADWPVECLTTTSVDLVVESILKLLEKVVLKLVTDGVTFVLCQKVVHPRMKKRLQKAGILVVDRLGAEVAKCVQYISGGNSITALLGEMSYGTISNITFEHLGSKSFLLLTSNDNPLFTFILAHFNEESSSELKVVCRQAMDSLLRILRNPTVCFGGGCSEIRTALLLSGKVRNNLEATKKDTNFTSSQVLESLGTFLRSIACTCVAIHQGNVLDFATEDTHSHLWRLQDGRFPTIQGTRCQCGNFDAASVSTASWFLLSDIGSLYRAVTLKSSSAEKLAEDIDVDGSFVLRDAKLEATNPILATRNGKPQVGPSSSSAVATDVSCCETDCVAGNMQTKVTASCPTSSPVCDSFSDSEFVTIAQPECLYSTDSTSLSVGDKLFSNPNLANDCFVYSNIVSKGLQSGSIDSKEPTSIIADNLPSEANFLKKFQPNNVSLSPIFIADPKSFVNATQKIVELMPLGNHVSSKSIESTQQFYNDASLKSSMSSDTLQLDESTCRLNSLSLAFETASLFLKTTMCINNLPV